MGQKALQAWGASLQPETILWDHVHFNGTTAYPVDVYHDGGHTIRVIDLNPTTEAETEKTVDLLMEKNLKELTEDLKEVIGSEDVKKSQKDMLAGIHKSKTSGDTRTPTQIAAEVNSASHTRVRTTWLRLVLTFLFKLSFSYHRLVLLSLLALLLP